MRLALATCERPPVPDADAERLIPALAERGIEAELVAWSAEGTDWDAYELVMISSTWDYHERLDEFLGWLRRTGETTRVVNPPSLIEWNVDKAYLRELAEAGVPIVPTVWVDSESAGAAVREAVERGWEELVVKPTVDLGAARLTRTDLLGARRAMAAIEGAAMVQPFLDSLTEEGELSLVYLGGELSHTIRKRPAEGDFRVQEQYGGRYEAAEPGAEADEIGIAAMELVRARLGGQAPLYGRVDLVRDPDGALCVAELELTEPSLFLHVVGEAETARLAELIAEAAGATKA